jgi:hypothetical protein
MIILVVAKWIQAVNVESRISLVGGVIVVSRCRPCGLLGLEDFLKA